MTITNNNITEIYLVVFDRDQIITWRTPCPVINMFPGPVCDRTLVMLISLSLRYDPNLW